MTRIYSARIMNKDKRNRDSNKEYKETKEGNMVY